MLFEESSPFEEYRLTAIAQTNPLSVDAADGKQARAEMAAELRDLLSAPSPAGWDRLVAVKVWEADADWDDHELVVRLSDAQAIIDGLREDLQQLRRCDWHSFSGREKARARAGCCWVDGFGQRIFVVADSSVI